MSSTFEIKKIKYLAYFTIATAPFLGFSQYTDVINSNRPGLSVSAYAVGRNVAQIEAGVFFEESNHDLLNTESNILGSSISLRYGLLFERLEINYEGTYQKQNITIINSGLEQSLIDFSRNRIGLKYLVYDRYKNPERNKPNLYSWKANRGFKLKNLIPSVALYGGATFNLGDNPFYLGDPTVSYRGMLATQSKLTPRFVLITNIAYDRITTDFPEINYLISLSHAFRNPKWSAFVEHQGIQSDRYADILLRGGIAHLLTDDLQVDFNMGASFKNTPSRIFATLGGSYRFDFHSDKLIPIDEQEGGKNGDVLIEKKSMKKKKKKGKKDRGAEDVDLGPSKKELKKLRKKEKKERKQKRKKDTQVIEF